MQNIFKWNALCWTNTIIFVFIFESNGQFMSYKFVGAQINQLTLFSKKLQKNRQVQIWSILINFDQIWSNLIKTCFWSNLIRFDQIWSDLIWLIFFIFFWKKYLSSGFVQTWNQQVYVVVIFLLAFAWVEIKGNV